ncbi:MAG: GNAT family N-acetyltransferase [Pricia sp.]
MVTFERATSEADLNQILDLQRKNLPANISSEVKKKEGFVTISHTFEMLKKMNDVCQHIVAKSDGRVIGYALCMHPSFAEDIEILHPMFEEVEAILPKIENYIVMGQVCIDSAYRGQGIFRKLYLAMQKAVQPEFGPIITDVNAENTRSLGAHYAVGFVDLATFSSQGQVWKIIRLD